MNIMNTNIMKMNKDEKPHNAVSLRYRNQIFYICFLMLQIECRNTDKNFSPA
jgi:hypothetical protein